MHKLRRVYRFSYSLRESIEISNDSILRFILRFYSFFLYFSLKELKISPESNSCEILFTSYFYFSLVKQNVWINGAAMEIPTILDRRMLTNLSSKVFPFGFFGVEEKTRLQKSIFIFKLKINQSHLAAAEATWEDSHHLYLLVKVYWAPTSNQ